MNAIDTVEAHIVWSDVIYGRVTYSGVPVSYTHLLLQSLQFNLYTPVLLYMSVFVCAVNAPLDGIVSSVCCFVIVFSECVGNFMCVRVVVCECDVFILLLSLIHILARVV